MSISLDLVTGLFQRRTPINNLILYRVNPIASIEEAEKKIPLVGNKMPTRCNR
jgi:hypothetical protein